MGYLENKDACTLNQLTQRADGYLESTGSDPFIIFPPFQQIKCQMRGFHFVVEFENRLSRAVLMEMFWRSENNDFDEKRKVIFILYPSKTGRIHDIVIPFDDLLQIVKAKENTIHQIRIDFPRSVKSTFRLLEFGPIDWNQEITGSQTVVEPLDQLSPRQWLRSDTFIPHTIKIIRHGLHRMGGDPVFFIIWGAIIILLLLAIRKVTIRLHHPLPGQDRH